MKNLYLLIFSCFLFVVAAFCSEQQPNTLLLMADNLLENKNVYPDSLEKDQGEYIESKSPPMGWNSWNYFGKKAINEQIVREVIDAFVEEGLKDAGYEYIVIDGGWRDTKLGANHELLPHPEKFPNGIKPLADYAHSKGLKLGLHTVPGHSDCGGDRVGAFGHEEVHIQQFIDWGIDYVKVDKCLFDGGWDEDVLKKTYYKWYSLLSESPHDILVVGNGGLTEEEQKVHFAIWCLVTAPLMLGNDPRNMSDFEKDIQLNAECIAINQDPTEQGRKIIEDGDKEIWGKNLSDGSMAVLLLNRNKTENLTVECNPDELGFGNNISIRDIYSDEDFVTIKGMIRKDLGPHEGWFIMVK